MKKKTNASAFLALLFSFVLFACNQQKSTEEPAKSTASSLSEYDPIMDPVKVEAAFIKLMADTLGIKLYEGTYKPGDIVDFHTHPDNIVYVLEGSTVELTQKDGTVNVVEFKTGMGMVSGPATHKGKVTGTSNLRLVVADIYRPRN